MSLRPRRRDVLALTAAGPLLWSDARAAAPVAAATIEVDLREATRHLIRTRLTFAAAPGPFALVYPKWLPGEHGPTGDINDVVALTLSANGKAIPWQRDPVDMYQIRCELPVGTKTVTLTFDRVSAAGGRGSPSPATGSARLAILKWNDVVFYPAGADIHSYTFTPSVRLPPGWRFATALETDRTSDDGARFKPVPLETLVDSPLACGANSRDLDLTPAGGPSHTLHLFADSAEALEIKPAALAAYKRLVEQAGRLFGGWPYRRYHFLYSLSDLVPQGGLEHHESSDNRTWERTLLDEAPWAVRAGLLPHEHVHAWNGKLRRPAGLVKRDYQQPMETELLWVYEGLTTYLGETLTARSGLRPLTDARDVLAYSAATLDVRPGRAWRSLADTAASAPVLGASAREWRSLRRGLDYYPESQLIWLEADVLIRQKTGGRRSLDDFCQVFHGRFAKGAPALVTYTFEDVLGGLSEVCPSDWRAFFQARVYTVTPRAPLSGVEQAGWKLVYRDQPSPFFKLSEQATKEIDDTFSLGLVLRDDGTILDVVEGLPAARAGVGAVGKVIAVNGRKLTREILRAAVAATKSKPDLELLVESDEYFRTYKLAYRGGNRFPALERDPKLPDLLSIIYTPRTPDPSGAPR